MVVDERLSVRCNTMKWKFDVLENAYDIIVSKKQIYTHTQILEGIYYQLSPDVELWILYQFLFFSIFCDFQNCYVCIVILQQEKIGNFKLVRSKR